MTIEELLVRTKAKRLIIHRGEVFFNERDWEEARSFQELGCRLVPFYNLEEQAYRERLGIPNAWEVHLLGACERVLRTSFLGEAEDITHEVLLEKAREQL